MSAVLLHIQSNQALAGVSSSRRQRCWTAGTGKSVPLNSSQYFA